MLFTLLASLRGDASAPPAIVLGAGQINDAAAAQKLSVTFTKGEKTKPEARLLQRPLVCLFQWNRPQTGQKALPAPPIHV